ncbi:branched-chain amino acid transport system II carrier protein [bacterium D16-34]|nr:branched-chain amino acid transport system II carrier protein [bacterium D16-34]
MLAIGGMLFSMFFGAGNLILPPLLGLQSGTSYTPAMVGFLLAGIGLPVLAVIALALCGGIRELAARVHPVFAAIFVALVYLTVGPFLAIPRSASTSFEMVRPLLPENLPISAEIAAVVFSIIFFGIAFLLALHPGLLSKIMGRFSAPLLIVLIILLVGSAMFEPIGTAQAPVSPYNDNALVEGFLNGYQTTDLLAALCYGIVVAVNAREAGADTPAKTVAAISGAGLIGGFLMGVIYVALGIVGVTMATTLPDATNGATVLAATAEIHFGPAGSVLIAAIFIIATLNVSTALVTCCSEYFNEVCPKIPLAVWAAIFASFSCLVSLIGLDAILKFSIPFLDALYPPAIVLVILGIFHTPADKARFVWPCAVLTTAAISVCVALRDVLVPMLWLPTDLLPFADTGFAWVIPAIVAVIVGVVVSRSKRKQVQ